MPRNRGKRLERLLDYMHAIYKNRRQAVIEKKEVPTRYDRQRKQMVYLQKTGFDYEGTIRGGRSICMEAKEAHNRLGIDPTGKRGLKLHQVEALLLRGELGAAAGVVWLIDWDKAYFLSHKFLKWFMDEVYNKPRKEGGQPVKSISIDLVKKHCPSIMFDGRLDYLDHVDEFNAPKGGR